MSNETKTNRPVNLLLVVVAVISVLGAAVVTLIFTGREVTAGESSPTVRKFVDPLLNRDYEQAEYTSSLFPSTYGDDEGARTLVLYDGNLGASEVFGIHAGNIATHFGQSTLQPIEDYRAGQMQEFDAVIYQGLDYRQELPQDFIADARTSDTKILWANANIEKLAGNSESPELAAFIEKYGWDPNTSQRSQSKITAIEYKSQELDRHGQSRDILIPDIIDPAKVEVLGAALCGSQKEPKQCEGIEAESFPWAIRSGNITYVGDLPFEWQGEGTHYLAFADLFFDLLAPDAVQTKKAAVRLEDVNPLSNPLHLRSVTDFLKSREIPFQVAVVPIFVSEVEDPVQDRYRGLTLSDVPEVVDALKYMQANGGTLLHHGTTHQYGAMQNPYQGASTTADYEFVRSRCSSNEAKPWQFEECKNESWVQLVGPLPEDKVSDHAQRIEHGRQEFIKAGLGAPEIFEVPHYGATPNAYEAIANQYDYRYEKTSYFAGLVSGRERDFSTFLTQVLPFAVTDVYGKKVLPENVGNPSIEAQNNHPARPPSLLIDNARKNLVVRDATASFFFHPFLDIKVLEEIVDGIEDLGYEFVPAKELDAPPTTK